MLGEPYATLGDLKDYLKIPTTKTAFDVLLEDALDSSSREIERACNRQFNSQEQGSSAGMASQRTYYPFTATLAYVDDFYTMDDLVVESDGVVWDAVDYEVLPFNGVVDGQEGWPFWKIHVAQARRFNVDLTVKVTALWGWEVVPTPIRQACLIMAAETFQMKDAPFGVAGMDIWGTPLRVRDNRIAAGKIARYVRNKVQVG